ncbi:MAG: MATE family efflux transporter, partial [Sphaerochaetaceae bacterium]
MKKSLERYFGTKAFYKMLLAVAIPIMVQQGFTNFVSMLDNIMVGRVGTEQMSGVAIVNQIIFVYNLCLFGGLSGVGIFTAQFFGKGDKEGIRNAFRFKLMLGFGLTALAIAALSIFSEPLIIQFLHDTGDGGSLEATLAYGRQYMSVMLLGLPAFMMVQVYSSTLRECGETIIPMKSGIAAVLVNLVFNYLLIYGKLGFPQLGVTGAAIATVMSRYVEAAIVMVWTHRHKFVVGVYRSMKVPKQLAKRIIRTGFPLLLNETLWSAGVAILTQCYSTRGLNAVAAYNISNTLTTLFNVVFIAMGNSVGIIVGRLLGCGRMDEAVETNRKIIFFDVLLASGI